MAYTKLDHGILRSSVWCAADSVRIVWLTMLAMKNEHGEVHATVPGLAAAAWPAKGATDETIAWVEQAIALFEAPDRWSRTPDNDGKRVAPIPGGWELLNSEMYRDLQSAADKRRKARERKARQRARERANSQGVPREVTPVTRDVTPCPTMSRHTDTETNSDLNLPLRGRARVANTTPEIGGNSASGVFSELPYIRAKGEALTPCGKTADKLREIVGQTGAAKALDVVRRLGAAVEAGRDSELGLPGLEPGASPWRSGYVWGEFWDDVCRAAARVTLAEDGSLAKIEPVGAPENGVRYDGRGRVVGGAP